MFVDLDLPLNASSLLSASAELLVCLVVLFFITPRGVIKNSNTRQKSDRPAVTVDWWSLRESTVVGMRSSRVAFDDKRVTLKAGRDWPNFSGKFPYIIMLVSFDQQQWNSDMLTAMPLPSGRDLSAPKILRPPPPTYAEVVSQILFWHRCIYVSPRSFLTARPYGPTMSDSFFYRDAMRMTVLELERPNHTKNKIDFITIMSLPPPFPRWRTRRYHVYGWIACCCALNVTRILPRDAMRKRGLCCRPVFVCLSVRRSVCHVRVLYPEG